MEPEAHELEFALKKNISEALPHMKSYIRKIELCEEDFEWGMPEKIPDDPARREAIQSLAASVERRYKDALNDLFLFYWKYTDPSPLCAALSRFDVMTSETYKKHFTIFDVQASVIDQFLIVKTPLVWSRYSHYQPNGEGKNGAYVDFFKWFDRELDVALFEKIEEIPHYVRKHISYVHSTPHDVNHAADSDNYDTKHITDVICNHMLSTDAPHIVSFSSFSVPNTTLPEGTYAVVSPTFGNPPALDALIEVIKSANFRSENR